MADFDKYRRSGAYHWTQVDQCWGNPFFNPPLLSRYEALARLTPMQAKSVLDVGCGDGYLLYAIACQCPDLKLHGVDNEPLGVRLAREQLRKYECEASLTESSAYSLPFDDSSFDVVFMADAIEHLEQPEKALQEVERVLKKEGTFLVSTPNQQPDIVWDRLHVREFNAAELNGLLADYFSEVQVTACWPMWWMKQWMAGGRKQQVINTLCRLGYNPFLKTTYSPSVNYGQLLAKCVK